MLKIRLRRMGSRQDPFYRVVVSESRRTPQSRFVETLGTYNPGTKPETIKLDVAKAESWIQKGAHPSETVRSLIAKAKEAHA
ncbi:MAG TPA: 30S ribosomal protein S16 [Candidatus Sulfotelmatobacter sp.]|nr:30S ribosomal protein S16 [Candidatus Sulfotelmatobacter sp.]